MNVMPFSGRRGEPDREKYHPTSIAGEWKTPEQLVALGVTLGRTRFDAMLCILYGLAQELRRQERGDFKRRRFALSGALDMAVFLLEYLLPVIARAFRISSAYLTHEFQKVPEIRIPSKALGGEEDAEAS